MSWTFPEDIPGWLTGREGWALAEAAKDKIVLEIGAYHGRSTICMAQTAKIVHTIDYGLGDEGSGYDFSTPSLIANLRKWDLFGKVAVHVCTVEDMNLMFQWPSRYFQFGFVDGAHDEKSVFTDLEFMIAVALKHNSFVALHDWDYPSVQAGALKCLGWKPSDPANQVIDRMLLRRL